eukprot:TRINITY_DN17466_c0_g1_i1.p1 TRINITY_DN17466_c0_g1~~TRINITY_DN17466_c0_g1_i1.p1  ORF type:complete len:159 (+),score=4.16 TRINITY_DN17466_c0_g1_i1:243-719(+)
MTHKAPKEEKVLLFNFGSSTRAYALATLKTYLMKCQIASMKPAKTYEKDAMKAIWHFIKYVFNVARAYARVDDPKLNRSTFSSFGALCVMHHRYHNPIMRVFIGLLVSEHRRPGGHRKANPRARLVRNRWLKAMTLVRNPSLRPEPPAEVAEDVPSLL